MPKHWLTYLAIAVVVAFLTGFLRFGNATDRAKGRFIVW